MGVECVVEGVSHCFQVLEDVEVTETMSIKEQR